MRFRYRYTKRAEDIKVSIHGLALTEALDRDISARFPHVLTLLGIREHSRESLRQGCGITYRYERTVDPITDDDSATTDVGCDYG